MKLRGSIIYIRCVLMLKVISVSIERVWSSLLASSAMVIAASSARLIVAALVGISFQYVWWCGLLD